MIVNKKAVSINIFFSLLQIVITGLVYYFLYKYLLQHIGLNLMGVWTIVLSISSTANVANLGIGSGVVRFTALFKTNQEYGQINKLIHTSQILLAGFFFAVIIIVYLVAPYWLSMVVDKQYYASAMQILPYSLACLFFNAVSGVYASCIDGLQKNYLRSIIFILSFLILYLGAHILVPSYGIMGIAYAQLAQALFLFSGMIVCLKATFRHYRIFSFSWDGVLLRKIFSFGIKEQIISVCQLCFDPLTKSMLSNFGSLSLVSYYEMASRLIIQLRGLLVSANQVFVPIFTNAQQKSAETTKALYRQVFSANFLMSILWASFLMAAIVPVSKMWVGNANTQFILIAVLLTIAYFFNVIISPAYFSNVGNADLKNNVICNMIIAVLNLVLCYILGHYFGGYGVVTGWTIALTSGSLYVFYAYHKTHKILISSVIKKQDVFIILAGMFYSTGIFLFFINHTSMNVWKMVLIMMSGFGIFGLLIYKIHPAGSILRKLLAKKPA